MQAAEDERYRAECLPRVRETVQTTVIHEFLTLLNPRYRGAGWKWSKFEAHCLRWAEIHVRNAFGADEWELWGEVARKDARRLARLAARRMLDESGILVWWPDPTRLPE